MTSPAVQHGTPGTLTILLNRASDGDSGALNQLFAITQDDLRRMAQQIIRSRNCPPGQIDGTELVSLACIKLLQHERLSAPDRATFFLLLGRAMLDEFRDSAKHANTLSQGGGRVRESFDHASPVAQEPPTRLTGTALRAVDILRQADPEAAAAVEDHLGRQWTLRQSAQRAGVSLHEFRKRVARGCRWLEARLCGRNG